MYEVKLVSLPHVRLERVERIVQKHSGGRLDHPQRKALLHEVEAGRPQVIARYHEEHAAENVVLELKMQGAVGEVAEVTDAKPEAA